MDCRTFLRAAAAVLSVLAFDAQAALIDNGDGTVTDDVSNRMWIKDFNLAATNSFGLSYNTDLGDHAGDSYAASYAERIYPGGDMNWGGALWWIDAMNAASYPGYNDWRLPAVNDIGASGCTYGTAGKGYGAGGDCGYSPDLATGELADLWYRALGNLPYVDATGAAGNCPNTSPYCLQNIGPFDNMQSDVYWSGTAYAPLTGGAWNFNTNDGNQNNTNKNNSLYAVAVRS